MSALALAPRRGVLVRGLALAAALGALASALPTARADWTAIRFDPPERAEGLRVAVRVLPSPVRAEVSGGWGYALVRVTNGGERERAIELRLADEIEETGFRAEATLRVAPGATRQACLPVPAASGRGSVEVVADGRALVQEVDLIELGDGATRSWFSFGTGSPLPALFVALPSASPTELAARLFGLGAPQGITSNFIAPDELPDRWGLLTAFAAVVVVGGAEGLDVEHERVLVDYARAGGLLVVLDAKGARADRPLARLIGPARGGAWFGEAGFGRFLASEATEIDKLEVPAGWAPRQPGWRAGWPTELARRPYVPGVGEPPIELFTALILGFCVLVGPVNYIVVKRRYGRPTRALVIAPLAGLTLSVGILVFGIFGDGFSVRGATLTVTVLDQRERSLVSASSRALFAGLSPRGGVVPGPGSWISAPQVPPSLVEVDMVEGAGLRFGAGLVPSRMPVHLGAATIGPARARLRFRREQGGEALRLLADEELLPTGPGDLVVWLAQDGVFYVLGESDRLEAAAAPRAATALQTLLGDTLELDDENAGETRSTRRSRRARRAMMRAHAPLVAMPNPLGADILQPTEPAELRPWVEGWWRQQIESARAGTAASGPGLNPGALAGIYVARVERAPGWDPLGLTVDERATYHLVLGVLAEQDVVD